VASATGPLLGGYLIAAASWRWIFFINIPVGVLVLVLSIRHVPESQDPTVSGHIDVLGAVVGMASLAAVTYALIEGPGRGFGSPSVLVVLVSGLVGGVVFLLVERASPAPMLPLTLFGERQFSVTNGVTFIIYAALGGALFLLPVELQVDNHYTAFQSGVSLIPLTVVMLLLSARSGRLASRIGPRLQMGVGPVVVGAGLALLIRTTSSSIVVRAIGSAAAGTGPGAASGASPGSYVTGVLPAVLVFGLGLAITVAPLTATALGAAPAEHAGVASAVNNYVARVGSLLAVAVLPALAGISGSSYLHAQALSAGFRKAMIISASMCAIGGVIAGIGIRNPPRVTTPPSTRARPERIHCALDAPPLGAET